MKLRRVSFGALFALLALAVFECSFSSGGIAQNQPGQQPAPTPTLNLDQGYLDFESPDFFLKLVKASQTVAALRPTSTSYFDFTPVELGALGVKVGAKRHASSQT